MTDFFNNVGVLPVDDYVDQICRKITKLELKVCTISHPAITNQHIQRISNVLQTTPVCTRLRKLDVIGCPNVTPNGVVVLCDALQRTSVSHLTLNQIHVGLKGIVALTNLIQPDKALPNNTRTSQMKMLSVEGCFHVARKETKQTIEAVGSTTEATTEKPILDEHKVWTEFLKVAALSVESLDLSRNGLSSIHLGGLTESLQSTSCRLKALILSENPISDHGFDMICHALHHNKSLVLLACAECQLSKEVVSSSMLTCLRSNDSIQRLYLYGNAPGTTLTAPGNEEAHHWLELNGNGRSFVGDTTTFRPEFLPFVLYKVTNRPSLIHNLLKDTPHVVACHGISSST